MARPGRKAKLIPTCLGTYEECVTCDGDGSVLTTGAPCAWRGRCRGFQAHIDETGEDEDDYIELVKITTKAVRERTGWTKTAKPKKHDHAGFNIFLRRLEGQYGTVDPEPEPILVPVEKPKKKPKKVKRRSQSKETHNRLMSLMKHFFVHLKKYVDNDISLSKRRLILPGMLFTVDARKKTGYITVYRSILPRRGKKTRKEHVLRIWPMKLAADLTMGLAVDLRDIQRVTTHDEFDMLGPKAGTSPYNTTFPHLSEDGLALLAEVIGRLVDARILSLPTA